MPIYRKIYEAFYGSIPKDSNGRSYDIHHIDGDKTNNSILNLVALSIQDHYDVHYIQGDYGACIKISGRLDMSFEEKSKISTLENLKRVANGTHPWIGPEHNKTHKNNKFREPEFQRKNALARVANGTHHFLNKEEAKNRQLKKVKDGTHHFLGGKIQKNLVEQGTHHFLSGKIQSNVQKKLKEQGRHIFHVKKTCPICNKTMSKANFIKWNHGENCGK